MLSLDRLQGVTQVSRRIALTGTGRDPKSEDLATSLADSMSRLDRSAPLDPSQALQQLGSLDLADRPPAQPREHILFQANTGSVGMLGTDLRGVDRAQPIPGHGLEATAGWQAGISTPGLLARTPLVRTGNLSQLTRVHALGDELAIVVGLLACGRETCVGVGSQAEQLTQTASGVVEAPPMCPTLDEQKNV
jgi:hypothetical protein